MTNTPFFSQRRKFISTSMVVASGAPLPVLGFWGAHMRRLRPNRRMLVADPLRSEERPAKARSLEVSSVGLGVQNMARTYQTTIPARPEMIDIIRTAYERGVTFFDTAEAYGPHECERILGEAIAPFRNKVVITSKFGWNIDPADRRARPRA